MALTLPEVDFNELPEKLSKYTGRQLNINNIQSVTYNIATIVFPNIVKKSKDEPWKYPVPGDWLKVSNIDEFISNHVALGDKLYFRTLSPMGLFECYSPKLKGLFWIARRLMKANNLLLSRYASKPLRVHDGKVMTLHSNTRWCSDGFYITCDNGERLQVAFSLDTCDREAMRYVASTRGIDGGMIRDLMAETLLYRFGEVHHTPQTIQWLSDNGPCYVARETVIFGRSIGLEICTTHPYSPESNGMAESFIKTFKRDYVWLGDLSSAQAVIEQLPKWFDDYNSNAPHKALKMMSPRRYIQSRKTAS